MVPDKQQAEQHHANLGQRNRQPGSLNAPQPRKYSEKKQQAQRFSINKDRGKPVFLRCVKIGGGNPGDANKQIARDKNRKDTADIFRYLAGGPEQSGGMLPAEKDDQHTGGGYGKGKAIGHIPIGCRLPDFFFP